MIGCHTGLRISDLSNLDKTNIVKNGTTLKVVQFKTKDIIFIPIHPRISELLNEYGGFPPTISDQKMNEGLKALCEKAGFYEETVYKKTEGGKVVIYKQKKWERVTNHTARRSFATNCVLAGIPERLVMKWTGHKDVKSFERYICVTPEEMLIIAEQNKFFK